VKALNDFYSLCNYICIFPNHSYLSMASVEQSQEMSKKVCTFFVDSMHLGREFLLLPRLRPFQELTSLFLNKAQSIEQLQATYHQRSVRLFRSDNVNFYTADDHGSIVISGRTFAEISPECSPDEHDEIFCHIYVTNESRE